MPESLATLKKNSMVRLDQISYVAESVLGQDAWGPQDPHGLLEDIRQLQEIVAWVLDLRLPVATRKIAHALQKPEPIPTVRCPICPAYIHPGALYEFGVMSHVECARTLEREGHTEMLADIRAEQGKPED